MRNLDKIIPAIVFGFLLLSFSSKAQTNVYDDVIASSPDHTTLTAALQETGLDVTLSDPGTFTVFAPDDDAFEALAAELGVTVPDLLDLPDLEDILLYHVLGSDVASSAITNGQIVTPLNDANTLKLTATSAGDVFINQAQVNAPDLTADNGIVHSLDAVLLSDETVADIAIDNEFTSLVAAVVEAELLPAITDPFAELTVFAPDNEAFDNLAAALGTDIDGILADPELANILLYHVLGEEVMSAMINNGDIVTPLNDANTIKLTATGDGNVFANQAQVEIADLTAGNGVVHAIDAVILSGETVADIAIDNGFTSLVAAVVEAELLPALTDPFSELTVFAPDNEAFDNLASELDTDLEGVLANPDLANILLYHVLGEEVMASMINNGDLVTPLNDENTVKLTATSGGNVFANQALVEIADLTADNGVVHAIDAVILSSETVVDVAIDNGFNTLTAAVIEAELLPALSQPFAEFTVFAPTDEAFEDLAEALDTDIDGILALANLGDILLYHVAGEELFAADLQNGQLTMLNDENTLIDLSDGVQINNATVIGPDNSAENGVVHVIDAVLDSDFPVSVENLEVVGLEIFPNPTVDFIRVSEFDTGFYSIFDTRGAIVKQGVLNGNRKIELSELETGIYLINLRNQEITATSRFVKQ